MNVAGVVVGERSILSNQFLFREEGNDIGIRRRRGITGENVMKLVGAVGRRGGVEAGIEDVKLALVAKPG